MDSSQISGHAAAFADVLSEAARAWLGDAMGDAPAATAVRVALARAARKLGDDPVDVSEVAGLDPVPRGTWRACDVGRTVLVLRALAGLDDAAQVDLVTGLIRRAEMGEQQSLLRMLPWLPDPARFVDAAVDACRTNAVPVFAAIATDNPYPAAYFSDAAFDQMVLKAIFIGVPVAGIVGLADRVTATTARMARDYADERRAAGREVPADVDHLLQIAQTETKP